jgi:hypothetical protein
VALSKSAKSMIVASIPTRATASRHVSRIPLTLPGPIATKYRLGAMVWVAGCWTPVGTAWVARWTWAGGARVVAAACSGFGILDAKA